MYDLLTRKEIIQGFQGEVRVLAKSSKHSTVCISRGQTAKAGMAEDEAGGLTVPD